MNPRAGEKATLGSCCPLQSFEMIADTNWDGRERDGGNRWMDDKGVYRRERRNGTLTLRKEICFPKERAKGGKKEGSLADLGIVSETRV